MEIISLYSVCKTRSRQTMKQRENNRLPGQRLTRFADRKRNTKEVSTDIEREKEAHRQVGTEGKRGTQNR